MKKDRKTTKPLIIGVTGGTGSGKTTVAKKIKEHFGDDVIYIAHDSYYRDQTKLTLEERKKTNYDHPNALETTLLIRHLKQLIKGHHIMMPVYDFTVSNRMKETVKIDPKPVIIVEGILVFESPKLRDLFDIKIYVDTDADVRLGRRIKRDIEERGRTLEHSLNQYLTISRPMHSAFIEPTKKYADIILPHGGENTLGIGLVISAIKQSLRR